MPCRQIVIIQTSYSVHDDDDDDDDDDVSFSAIMARYGSGYMQDMNFLGHKVWPRVQSVAYCHDSFTCRKFPASHPFPVERRGTEHLGQVFDQFSIGRPVDIDILRRARVNVDCVMSRDVKETVDSKTETRTLSNKTGTTALKTVTMTGL